MSPVSPLAHGEFLYFHGHLAHAGRLWLSDEQIAFDPHELERIAGSLPWRVALSEVRRVEHLGMESILVVETGADTYRCQGAASLALYRRLLPLLVRQRAHDLELAPLPAAGRVLVHAPATRLRKGAIDVAGHLWMTPGRLRFVPVGVGRLVGAGAEFDLALADIATLERDAADDTLACHGSQQVYTVKSPAAAQVYALWQALRKRREADREEGACYAARYVLPQGAVSGQLVVAPHRWRFVADVLRSGTGNQALSAAWDVEVECARAHALSAEPGALTVHLESGTRRFELLEAEQLLDALPTLWTRAPATGEAELDEAGIYRHAAALERLAVSWSWVIGVDVLAEPILAGPVILHLPERRLERHQLLLTSSAIVLLPDEGPSAERGAVVFRHLGGLDPRSPELRRSRIDLQIGAQRVSLHPRGGRAFVERFWDQLPAGLTSSNARGGTAASADAASLPLPVSEQRVDNRRESYRVSPVEDRIGTLKVRVLPHEALPATGEPPGEETSAPAPPLVEGQVLAYVLKDVSPEGMGVWLERALPLGTRVEVQLQEGAARFAVGALVVNCRSLGAAEPRVHCGLRLTEPEGALRQRIQSLWTQLQRQRVATRERLRPPLAGMEGASPRS